MYGGYLQLAEIGCSCLGMFYVVLFNVCNLVDEVPHRVYMHKHDFSKSRMNGDGVTFTRENIKYNLVWSANYLPCFLEYVELLNILNYTYDYVIAFNEFCSLRR